MALALATAGARVIIVGRQQPRLEETCALFAARGNSSGSLEALAGDLCLDGTLDRLASNAPHVDLLIHNAAAYAPYAVLERSSHTDVSAVWDTVVIAALKLTQAVLPSMKAQRYGRILFIGSAAASLGGTGQTAYSAAKAALVGLTRSLACETAGFGITCNLLELGLIDTERTQGAIQPRRRQQLLQRIPVGRAGTPEEVARIVTFLTSDDAAYIHGATIPVTGGLGLGLLPFGTEDGHADQ